MKCVCSAERDLLRDPELLATSSLSYIATAPGPLQRHGSGFRLRACAECGAVYFPDPPSLAAVQKGIGTGADDEPELDLSAGEG